MLITHGLSQGQVLQRINRKQARAIVGGNCDSSGSVIATITSKKQPLRGWKQRRVGRAANGRFSARLDGIPVGGPYAVKLSVGAESVVVQKIWVGDVWLLAGQSNMQGCGNLDGAPRPDPRVHAMYMDDHWDVAREPIHFLAESPDPVHCTQPVALELRERMRREAIKGVGPGVFFGKEMLRRTRGTPQGLICTAHGGTSMAQWNPELKHLGGKSLYGSMLRSFQQTGQPVAGVLWYQGESDAGGTAALLYTERMKAFVAAIRKDFKLPNLPFILVQIGRFFGIGRDEKSWNNIQAQQLRLKRKISRFDCVPAVDLQLDDQIHVGAGGCARLGARLACVADRLALGNLKEPPPPELASITRIRKPPISKRCTHALELTFKNVVGGLRSQGEPSGFTFITKEGQVMPVIYKTTLDGNRVILESSIVNDDGQYRLMYGHGCAPCANITDARDMALPVWDPQVTEQPRAISPFILDWKVSGIQPATGPLDQLPPPQPEARLNPQQRTFAGPFVDLHSEWDGRSGQVFFFSEILTSETMKLQVRMGYDGPFRIWVNQHSFFTDVNGANPAVPDAVKRPLSLAPGRHSLTIAMDLNQGLAWGFFLRFERIDLTEERIEQGGYAMPVCALREVLYSPSDEKVGSLKG